MNKEDKILIQEALDNNLKSRLFYFYQQYIDKDAIIPKDDYGWKNITDPLRFLVDIQNKKERRDYLAKIKLNGQTTSTRS